MFPFHLWRKFLELVWKRVLEMSTLFSLCYGVSILGTHVVDILLIPKICWNRADWTRTNAYRFNYLLDRKTSLIQWMTLTCSSVVEIFWRSDRGLYFVLSLPHLNSAAHYLTLALEREYSASICNISSQISLGVKSFFCRYFMSARTSVLSIFRFVVHLSPFYGPQLHRNLDYFF